MVELVHAQTFSPDAISGAVGPALQITVAWIFAALVVCAILGILIYFFWLRSFNIKITVYELSKSNRTIVTYTKAKLVKQKDLSYPILKLVGQFGFHGDLINQPPSDCSFPIKGKMGNKLLYNFIKKDGIYYPISNAVLGKMYSKEGKPFYSIEGSGLEIHRDFESEKSTLNNLVLAGDKYRNKKPIEIAAMYGLMIIIVAGSFIVLGYAFYKVGVIEKAALVVAEAVREAGNSVSASQIGPG